MIFRADFASLRVSDATKSIHSPCAKKSGGGPTLKLRRPPDRTFCKIKIRVDQVGAVVLFARCPLSYSFQASSMLRPQILAREFRKLAGHS